MIDFTHHSTWTYLFLASEWAIRLVMLVVVPFRRSPEAAKGWLLLILFEPWVGLAVYWLIGRATLPRWRLELLKKLPDALHDVTARLRAHPNIVHPELGPELDQAVTLAENLGRLPILDGNAVELLADYDGAIDRLVADIDAARHHVHLLYYIFADDRTGGKVLAALRRAAGRGVRCRVLVDALGSRGYLRGLRRAVADTGIELREMLPVGLFRRKAARLDLRNHRKIAVVDGAVGYAGSQNLVDAEFKPGLVFEELGARVTGPIVLELQFVFVEDWFLETEEVLHGADVFPDPVRAGAVAAQALPSGPSFPAHNNLRLVLSLLYGARRRVVITTPYFIPNESLLLAMKTAATRGVEVHLIVSRAQDQLLVGLAQKSYYEELLEAGVQIHLYHARFLHAKHLSVDDQVAVVGSSNMDIRSFVLNAEVLLLFYGPEVAGALRAHQERYLAHADPLTAEAWARRPLWRKVFDNLARLLSPLL